MKRKKYSSQLKSKVALAALKAQSTDMVNIVKRKSISPVAILSMKQNSLKFLSVHSQRRSHLVSTVDHSNNEIASEHGVHTCQVNRWKKQATEGLPGVFGNNQTKTIQPMEQERDGLFQQIGKLQVELDWLKKRLGSCYECC